MIKLSPIRIILAHWRTFGDVEGGHKFADVVWFYIVSAHKRLDPAAGARFHAARRPCVACGCL